MEGKVSADYSEVGLSEKSVRNRHGMNEFQRKPAVGGRRAEPVRGYLILVHSNPEF